MAVAWMKSKGEEECDGARCDACEQYVPVTGGKYEAHARERKSDSDEDEECDEYDLCDSSGEECRADSVTLRGGKWVVLAQSGKVLGMYGSREEAEAQENAVEEKKADGRVLRCDLAQLAPPLLTADGFLQVEGRVARTGVQVYRNADGSSRRELRLPEEVRASVPGFALAPFTNDHPAEGVTPENARKTVCGAVGDAQLNGDGWVTAPIRIYAADAIESTKSGRVQLSVGYSCRLDAAPGEWQGQKYDAVQREIVVNHVALVDMARAGEQARLRLDAATADLACDTPVVRISTSVQENNRMPHELRIDGLVFTVNDPNAQAAYDRALKQRDDALAAATTRVTNADTLVATAAKDRDTAQAARDNALSEVKSLKETKIPLLDITVADACDPAKCAPALQSVVEASAAARATLLLEARKHLGANERFDAYVDPKTNKDVPAKSDLEIKKLVIEKLDSTIKLDGKSADYVQARYDGLVESVGKSAPAPSVRTTMNAVPTPTNTDAAPTDPQAARRAFEAKMIADNLGNSKRN